MSLYSINAFQSSSFFALPSSEELLSDNELDQILNQPYEDAASEITTLDSFDFPMMDDFLDIDSPPTPPLLPQFIPLESPKANETKKRKKEDEVLPAEVSADPTIKKKKPEPTKLTDCTIESMEDSDIRLIKAVVDVIIYRKTRICASEESKKDIDTISRYVSYTFQVLSPSTENEKKIPPRCREIVDLAAAKCQALINADPSLKANMEKTRAEYLARVNKLKNKKTAPTNQSDRNLKFSRKKSDTLLIDAIVNVIIHHKPKKKAAEECGRSLSTIKGYVKRTLQWDPSTENEKKAHHRVSKIVNSIAARCQALINEKPSLKANMEQTRAIVLKNIDTPESEVTTLLTTKEKKTTPIYRNNLNNRFLTPSTFSQNSDLHSRLAHEQWSLAPDQNFERSPGQTPDSSSCFGIKLSDRNLELSRKKSDDLLIQAIVDVIIYNKKKKLAAEECDFTTRTLRSYVKDAQQLLKSPIENEKTYHHTRPEILDAAVAKCKALQTERII